MKNETLTLGSLFDGSGGFPLAGILAGVTPIWASEVEPFPIRVTTRRLPTIKHYGDVSALNGAELERETAFDVRAAFGSRDDADHAYNTPRAWIMHRYLSPESILRSGDPDRFRPESDRLPFMMKPDRKITVEDVKYVLSDHYQGTPYDPYGRHGSDAMRGALRPIGINRNNILALTQIRGDFPEAIRDVQWIAMGSNVFNGLFPFYCNVSVIPAYFSATGAEVSTEAFYWANRLIGAMADAHFPTCASPVERYQNRVHGQAHAMLEESDAAYLKDWPEDPTQLLERANQAMSDMAKKETDDLLGKVLYQASLGMKNAFARSDA